MKTSLLNILRALFYLYHDLKSWSLGKKDTTLKYLLILLTFLPLRFPDSVFAEELFVLNSSSQLVQIETNDLSTVELDYEDWGRIRCKYFQTMT